MSTSSADPEPVECCVCWNKARVYASFCDRDHYVCAPCLEHMIFKIVFEPGVFVNRMHTIEALMSRAPNCPLCRGGKCIATCLSEDAHCGEMHGNLFFPSHVAQKLHRPICFRRERSRTMAEAVTKWMKSPRWTYECAVCGETHQNTTDTDAMRYASEKFSAKCTVCDICGVLGPWDQVHKHYIVDHIHKSPVGLPTRASVRIACRELRQLQESRALQANDPEPDF